VVILRVALSVSTMPSPVTPTAVVVAVVVVVSVVDVVVAVAAVAVASAIVVVVAVAVVDSVIAVVAVVVAVVDSSAVVASRARRPPFKVVRRTCGMILRALSNCALWACWLSALRSCTPNGVVGLRGRFYKEATIRYT